MDTIRLSIQQIDAISIEYPQAALLYPQFGIWPYAVSKVLPPDSQEISPKDSANLILVYSDQDKHFYLALPAQMLIEPLKIGSSVRLRYEYISDSKDAQNTVFEWTPEIRPFDEVMQILSAQKQPNAVMLYSVSTSNIVFSSFLCSWFGCGNCVGLTLSGWYNCHLIGCC